MSPSDGLPSPQGHWYPVSTVAKSTPYSATFVRQLARQGKIEAVKIGRDWLTTEQSVLRYIQTQQRRHEKALAILQTAEKAFLSLALLVMVISVTPKAEAKDRVVPSQPDTTISTTLLNLISGWQNFTAFYAEELSAVFRVSASGLAAQGNEIKTGVQFLAYRLGSRPDTVVTTPNSHTASFKDRVENLFSSLSSLYPGQPVLVEPDYSLMNVTHSNAQSTSAQPALSQPFHGSVLRASIVKQSLPTQPSVSLSYVQSLVAQTFQSLLSKGLLTGPQGPQGLPGSSVVDNGNGKTTAMINENPIVTYVPAVSGTNFSGGSLAGFTDLSAGTFTSGDSTINGNLNVSGPIAATGAVTVGSLGTSGNATINGTLTAASSTLASLVVSGSATFTGSTTIAGLTVDGFNPGLTPGSVAFQGLSGLVQDNANLFYDSGDHRLGLGTTTPSQLLTVAGNGLVTGQLTVSGPTLLGTSTISSLTLGTPLPVVNGGTGVNSLSSLTGGTGLSVTGGQSVLIGTSTQITLNSTGTPGTYGSSSQVPVLTTNQFGEITGVANDSIGIAASQITSGVLGVSNGGLGTTTLGSLTVGSGLSLTGGQNVLIGTSTSLSLGPNVVTAVTNGTNVTGSISGNALTLGWQGQLSVANGGTGSASYNSGGVIYAGTSALQSTSAGSAFQVLNAGPNGTPTFSSVGTLLSQGSNIQVSGTSTIAVVSSPTFSGLTVTGPSTLASSTITNLSLLQALPVASGGTGTTTLSGLQNALSLAYLSIPSQNNWYNYAAWGDSLTAGNEDGTGVTFPNVLQTLEGEPVLNEGVGGQTSSQIAVREGGDTTVATVSGGQIPASGGVTVTFTTGYEPVTSQGPSGGTSGSIAGVPGVVTLSGSTYTFTRSTGGTAVSTSSAPFIVNTPYFGYYTILWAGRNNSGSSTTVETDIAKMISTLPSPKRFLILSIINGQGEGTGTQAYTNITGINSYLAATYPNNYIDIREYLVGLYSTSTGADALDYANDIPPSSLRAVDQSGTITQNVTATTTSFTTSAPSSANTILKVGSEEILVNSVSGNTVTSATRGYGSTTPASYSSGQAYTGIDFLHLGYNGLTDVANNIASWLSANDPGVGSHPLNVTNLPSVFAAPPYIGAVTPSYANFSQLAVGSYVASGSPSGGIVVSGNSGIGTNNPISTLTVAGASPSSLTGTSTLQLMVVAPSYGYSGIGFTGANNPSSPLASIAMRTGGSGSYLQFGTTDNWSSGITNAAMTIDYLGRVGIGTTGPLTTLTVDSSPTVALTGTSTLQEMIRTDQYGLAGLDFGMGNSASNPLARIAMSTGASGSYLNFGTSNAWSSGITNTAMTIDYSGRVGIGTTSPSQTLTVGNNNQFTVNGSGNATVTQLSLNGVYYSWPSSQGGANQVLANNGSGSLSWINQSGGSGGGSGGWSTSTPNYVLNATGFNLVGINTSSPIAALSVENLSGSTTPILEVASSSGASDLIVAANGFVGVGTNNPLSPLHVYTRINTPSFTGSSTLGLLVDGSGYTGLDFVDAGGSGDTIPKARIAMSENATGSYLQFGTTNNWSSGINNTAMTIDYLGRVGIGTTGPISNLTVEGASPSSLTGTSTLQLMVASPSYGESGIGFTELNNPSSPLASIVMSTTGSGSYLNFGTSNAWSSGITNTAMTIDYSGRVGIGTSTPDDLVTIESPTGADTIPALGSDTGKLELLNYNNQHPYGLVAGVAGTGDTYFQSERLASTTAAYNILLQPRGGNVEIGTTTASALLTVQGNANSAALLNISSSTGSSLLYVSSQGNVGLGATAPVTMLQIGIPSSGLANNHGDILLADNGVNGPEAAGGIEIQSDSTSYGQGYKIYSNDTNGYLGIAVRYNSASWTNELAIMQQTPEVEIGTTTINSSSLAIAQGSILYGINVQSSNSGGDQANFNNNATGNGCYLAGAATNWSCYSDENLKTNIAPISGQAALQALASIQGVTFNWKSLPDGPQQMGLIAQEVQQSFPQAVTTGPTGYLSLQYDSLIGPVISAIDQLNASSTSDQNSLEVLQNQLSALLQGSPTGNATTSNLAVLSPSSFSGDSVGEAEIPAGQTSVRVSFSRPYAYQPIVTFSPEGSFVPAFIAEKDAAGFTLALESAANKTTTFDWHSFASPTEQLTVSGGATQFIVLVVASQPLSEPSDTVQGSNMPGSEDQVGSSTPPSGQVVGEATGTPEAGPSTTTPVASETSILDSNSNASNSPPSTDQSSGAQGQILGTATPASDSGTSPSAPVTASTSIQSPVEPAPSSGAEDSPSPTASPVPGNVGTASPAGSGTSPSAPALAPTTQTRSGPLPPSTSGDSSSSNTASPPPSNPDTAPQVDSVAGSTSQ